MVIKVSKIDELLKNEKVEWKKVSEVISQYKEKQKNDSKINLVYTVSKDFGIISSIDYWIKNNEGGKYINYSEDISNYNIIRKNMFAYNPSRLNIGSIDCLFDKPEGVLSPMYVIFQVDERIINPKYLLFYLKSEKVLNLIDSKKEQGARFRFDFERWNFIKIPIPSLKTQEKIVKILDKFTNYVTELQAELQSRNKQYEYYRDMLLSEKYLQKLSENPEFLGGGYRLTQTTLGEIGEIKMCKRILKDQTFPQGDVPFYKIGTFGKKADAYIKTDLFNEYKEKYSYPRKGEILISASGTIGRTVIFDGMDAYYQDSNIVWIDNNEELVLNKYLYYFYQIVNWNPSGGGTIKRLYNYNLKNIKIILPPIEVQEYVVGILDKFESLTSNISEGLPKEIDLRQKEYEYYREKLLDFPKN